MLISVCVGVLLLSWHMIANYIFYILYVGPVSLNEMGSMFLNEIYSSHARTGFDLFAPILAVLPASTLFCDDYSSGYLKSILGRVDQNRYIRETVICSSISGGLAVFLPSLITSVFYIIIGSPNTPEMLSQGQTTFLDESIFASIQFVWGGGLVVLLLLVLAFLFGALWANVGLWVSSVIPNRYMTLAGPFVLYFALHLIFYRVGFLLVLSPVSMLMPVVTFISNLAYPFVYQILLSFLVISLFKGKVGRRIADV